MEELFERYDDIKKEEVINILSMITTMIQDNNKYNLEDLLDLFPIDMMDIEDSDKLLLYFLQIASYYNRDEIVRYLYEYWNPARTIEGKNDNGEDIILPVPEEFSLYTYMYTKNIFPLDLMEYMSKILDTYKYIKRILQVLVK
jgi:hypothetical protein